MQKNNNIKLGLFVSIGLLILILAIYSIGKKEQLFNTTSHISSLFKNINGLQIGNNVRFGGINIGVIDDIEMITDTSIRVDFSIDNDALKFIKTDSKAVVGTDGLMGNKIVVITPGNNSKKTIKNNDYILTTQPVSIDEILANLKTSTDNAATITGDLSAILENIRNGKGTIGKLFMDTVFADNLDQTIVNIKEGAGGFKQNMNAASKSILLRKFFKKKSSKKKSDKE